MMKSHPFPGSLMSFEIEKHIKYFLSCLKILPNGYSQSESNRMSFLYFCLNGLATLQAMDKISSSQRKNIIDWIYSQQIKRVEGS